MSHAVTANRLRDGRVVFRTASGGWSLDVADSVVEANEAAANLVLADVVANADAQDVVEAYVVEVDTKSGKLRPSRLREAIRALGPTIAYLPPATTNAQLEAAE